MKTLTSMLLLSTACATVTPTTQYANTDCFRHCERVQAFCYDNKPEREALISRTCESCVSLCQGGTAIASER